MSQPCCVSWRHAAENPTTRWSAWAVFSHAESSTQNTRFAGTTGPIRHIDQGLAEPSEFASVAHGDIRGGYVVSSIQQQPSFETTWKFTSGAADDVG